MKVTQKIAVSYIRAKFKLLASLSKKRAAEKAFDLFRTPQTRNKKELPPIFKEAEKLHFKFTGTLIRGYRFNKGGNRKVLLLHGYESSVINFDRYVKPLIRKGYEVLAFDAPAHGRSGGKMISAPEYKKMIIEINKSFGPIESFMSHSFGGLALALAMEEIKHDENHRLVFIAPATETTTAINFFFTFLRLDEAVRKEFDSLILKLAGQPASVYSIARAMKNIKASVHWYHDEDDTITPLSDALPVKEQNYLNVKFVITKGLGHSRIYRDNKVSKSIIEFL
jgi:pimeloyl-ACP methyl ester carboxylesterase